MTHLTQAEFLASVERHQMSVLLDNGVYRHVRFKRPDSGCMHFDLITLPGKLLYTGDMGTFAFERLHDMFEFFRTDAERARPGEIRVNKQYWAEKLIAANVYGGQTKGGAMEFSEELFRRVVNQYRVEWVRDGARRGTLDREQRRALWEEVDNEVLYHLGDDNSGAAAFRAAFDFSWRPNYSSTGREWGFTDFWDHTFETYTHSFRWCCFAIAWGIAQYDEAKKREAAPA